MVEAYEQVGGNLVAALEVPDGETHKYGVIDPGASDGRLTDVRAMVEKPAPGTAPSNLMLPGRYILQPEVMRALDAQEKGAGGEIQLTDAMAKLIGTQPFHAYRFEGERYDCGSAAGFVIANLAMAMARDDIAPAVTTFAASLRGALGRGNPALDCFAALAVMEAGATAPARRPSRDNPASFRADSSAGTPGRAPAAASWSGGSARA
jgi:UTP--glucose-1-phosphate uridylyltransferase